MPEAIDVVFRDRAGARATVHAVRQGCGPSVLLLHGVGMRAAFWDPQIAALSSAYDLTAVDLPGHGMSSLPPLDAELGDYTRAVLAVLDDLEIAEAHVIGHSMGALVALDLALKHPDRTSSVVAMNAVFCRTPEQSAAVAARLESVRKRDGDLDWSETMKRWFGDVEVGEVGRAADRIANLLAIVDREGYERTYRVFATSDAVHRHRLRTLKRPALFLTGERDRNSNPAMSSAMAALAPAGEAAVVPGERHMMAVTAPDEINRRLIAFLSRTSSDTARRTFDVKDFRKALGGFPTGVTVVSTVDGDDAPRGFTANSFTSVSLDPPLILVCIAKTASSCPIFSEAAYFAVNVLAGDQTDVSSLFASKRPDRFSTAAWHRGQSGVPLLDGTAAWFECRRERLVEAGDHVILVGEVLRFGHTPSTPLAYCRGAHVALSLDVDRLAVGGRVGAILEHDGSILLERLADGSIDIPWGMALGDAERSGSLRGRLHERDIDVSIGFIFAVFEDAGRAGRTVSVVYRGSVRTPGAEGTLALFAFDAMPWSEIGDAAVRTMLERYIDERRSDISGVYVGDAANGVVQRLQPDPAFQEGVAQ